MIVDSEMLFGPDFDIVVYLGSIVRWESPHGDEEVSEADRKRIRANLEKGLRRLKVDWHPGGRYVGRG